MCGVCSSGVRCLPSMCEATGSIPKTLSHAKKGPECFITVVFSKHLFTVVLITFIFWDFHMWVLCTVFTQFSSPPSPAPTPCAHPAPSQIHDLIYHVIKKDNHVFKSTSPQLVPIKFLCLVMSQTCAGSLGWRELGVKGWNIQYRNTLAPSGAACLLGRANSSTAAW